MPKTPQHRVDDLKTSGLKATLPRLRVLKAFEQASHRHLSAEDVYKQLLSEGADVGLATVYRVLAQFAQAGLLTRSQLGADHAVFELNEGEHHDHLVCLHCGRVEEFFDPEIENIQRRVAQERGFELREHSLALFGRCKHPDCRPGNTDEPS